MWIYLWKSLEKYRKNKIAFLQTSGKVQTLKFSCAGHFFTVQLRIGKEMEVGFCLSTLFEALLHQHTTFIPFLLMNALSSAGPTGAGSRFLMSFLSSANWFSLARFFPSLEIIPPPNDEFQAQSFEIAELESLAQLFGYDLRYNKGDVDPTVKHFLQLCSE